MRKLGSLNLAGSLKPSSLNIHPCVTFVSLHREIDTSVRKIYSWMTDEMRKILESCILDWKRVCPLPAKFAGYNKDQKFAFNFSLQSPIIIT